ncbi:hypothetical protein A9Q99_05455 [Gammaproteobacteria bacterium 45_16_T64]|nr:hypothetical protein A9Q99_05455 [Gammaproteobacteria bacterium 45_16_T64]
MQHRFKPTFFLSLFCLVLLSTFVSLGVWQVNRVEEKQQMQAEIEYLMAQPARNLNQTSLDTIAQHQKATVTGQFKTEHQFLLDNIIQDGKPGYYVMTPFMIEGTQTSILINRGWVHQGKNRQQLPSINTPSETLTLTGKLANPRSKPVVLGNLDTPKSDQTPLWFYMDLAYFRLSVDYPVLPLVLRLDPTKNSTLIRHWPEFSAKTGMHIGYAIQWFVFALFVLFAFVGTSVKKEEGLLND